MSVQWSDSPLFASRESPPLWSLSLSSLSPEERRAWQRSVIALLVPIAQALAKREGRAGVCVEQVKVEANARGMAFDWKRDDRLYSFLWRVMPEAGLVVKPGATRTNASRNKLAVWVQPEYATRKAA